MALAIPSLPAEIFCAICRQAHPKAARALKCLNKATANLITATDLEVGETDWRISRRPVKPTLYWAAKNGYAAAVSRVLKDPRFARTKAKKELKDTALFWAIKHNHPEVVGLMLEAGADQYYVQGRRRSAMETAIKLGHLESVKVLWANHRGQMNVAHEEKKFLSWSLIEKQEEVALWFLEQGVKASKRRAFDEAVRWGLDQVVSRLIAMGVKFRWGKDEALRTAATYNQLSTLQILLDAGANFDNLHSNALRFASERGHDEIVTLLLQKRAKHNGLENPLIDASQNGHHKVVTLLLAAGANVQFNKFEALSKAARFGHDKVVTLLLAAETPPHEQFYEPLRIAAFGGHVKVVEILIAAGADVHACNDQALYDATRQKHTDVVVLLLKAGWGDAMVEEEKVAMAKGGHCEVVKCCLHARLRRREEDEALHPPVMYHRAVVNTAEQWYVARFMKAMQKDL